MYEPRREIRPADMRLVIIICVTAVILGLLWVTSTYLNYRNTAQQVKAFEQVLPQLKRIGGN